MITVISCLINFILLFVSEKATTNQKTLKIKISMIYEKLEKDQKLKQKNFRFTENFRFILDYG